MLRRPSSLGISLLALVGSAASGCSSTNDRSIELRLGDGADTATATFDAEDPRSHTQTIRIELEPADADVSLDFQTTDRATLSVYPNGDCDSDDRRKTCTVRFPILEAVLGGEWHATASKSHGPPAIIDFEITWDET